MADQIRVRPPEGRLYRHTRSHQLVPLEGIDADPSDLDVSRALDCGDLVLTGAAAPSARARAPRKAKAPPKAKPGDDAPAAG